MSLCLGGSLPAAEIDLQKLPPSAKVEIEFVRDIQPIFESSCLRCHGPEKPKSHFRLDNRESALQGGGDGVDILPGESAKSPLVYYVSGLVEEMEMPPRGKGDPLSPEQIGLLRAWIDQGAHWSVIAPARVEFSIAPTFRYLAVEGDKKSFREIEGGREGGSGGVEHFFLQQKISPATTVVAEGHGLARENDFAVHLSLDKTDTGFIHGGVEQWRSYYDDSGVFYEPARPSLFSLNRDLHLDLGRAWIDLGLTLPNWPQMVLGYEYQWKDGEKSTLQYGTANGKNIFPSVKKIDEQTHILKFDFVYERNDWRIEDNARVEFYNLKTRRENVNQFTFGPQPESVSRIDEGARQTLGVNTIRIERAVGDWLFLAGGYLYSRFEGDASYDQLTLDATGVPLAGLFWYGDNIILRRETHLFSVSSAVTAIEGLTLSATLQNEWGHQEGFGNIHLDEGDPSEPGSFLLQPASVDSNLDREKFSEIFAARFTRIPWTVLFAEARWQDERIGQFEEQIGGGGHAFQRDTVAGSFQQKYEIGFNISPWRPVSFTLEYKKEISDSDYDHLRDVSLEGDGYSAFIRDRQINTGEVLAKLVLRPAAWMKTTLSYRLVVTDYSTRTDPVADGAGPVISPGGQIFSGNNDDHIFSLNAVFTPIARLNFSTAFSYTQTRAISEDNGSFSVVPYAGDIFSVLLNVNYALNKTTRLETVYSFSQANYGRHNSSDGIPLGINYTRHVVGFGVVKKWSNSVSTNLRYNFYNYSEPSSGNQNSYRAHGIFATLNFKWP
ncbi:MAG: c-type cytochrome domain-containing protein [Verrucomicrobiota bacterium]